MIPRLTHRLSFPNPLYASEEGIVAYGGDLSPSRLMLAYRSGIFPWYSTNDPILWWSPDPRLILDLDDFKLSRSLRKKIPQFEIRFDSVFSQVINECSTAPRRGQKGSWIVPEMIEAYETLHALGYAHSVEAFQNGVLVGGLYGVSVGGVFCGESMFAKVSDASKVAFAVLVEYLRGWGFEFIDCQVPTNHLKSLGAKEVSRESFLKRLYDASTVPMGERLWKIGNI
ncbi:leucyl/phenylalanyl-tRNA--protein transferase [Sulfuricurvum sp. RIFCSPLOWO2_12_FULL_43_24]|uniref:leucyl/phenylalanyl-tRNA--protein transferase n=1 Tax=Sulfuricurvum sp. RIFCSPLOWO2_12_FULL_43_24 TaxID=1802247 RepID=UPI0008CEDC51|nr:leucyl/phenylalanyl-tRNA--protein transferase [Sulfuricurvum sp. RIFCSPLOWO2_12_FULL_43_24]OHD87788.1 MAG: leucyl/phenylalanyl-tRNA--protein transferase [Sulfuricurvum sp. RIFCSPLOWO2_02_43_6]OHD89148.1 MAG: leucyl/phenylalanyl-tRNA--protein transferase [Sulfuricurvum sp. RIFCSPLOWO2_12_FULL_43_24]